MNSIKRVVSIFLCVVILMLTFSCTDPGGPGGSAVDPVDVIELQAKINPTQTDPQKIDLSSTHLDQGTSNRLFEALEGLSVDKINQRVLALQESNGIHTQSLQPPIRGLNALMLSKVIATANGLRSFSFAEATEILAVKRNGEVVEAGVAKVNEDGSFTIEIQREKIGLNEPFALVIAEIINGERVCKQAFEIDATPEAEEEGEKDNEILVLEFGKLEKKSLSTQQTDPRRQEITLGDFGNSPESGNPENIEPSLFQSGLQSSQTSNFAEDSNGNGIPDFVESCSGNKAANPTLEANLDITPSINSGFGEEIFYLDTTLMAFDITADINTAQDDTAAVIAGAAGINGQGTSSIPIPKLKEENRIVKTALVDVLFINGREAEFPAVPFFDPKGIKNPNESSITIGNNDLQLSEQPIAIEMATIRGVVRNPDGTPANKALVIGNVDRGDVIDFNMALTSPNGEYILLLPILNGLGTYTIFATSQNGTFEGIGLDREEILGDKTVNIQLTSSP